MLAAPPARGRALSPLPKELLVARSRTASPRRARRPRRRAATAAAAATADKHVVYVHGICRHDPGYSDPWWAAMKPYVPDVPDANRHEVLWSDIITPSAAAMAPRSAALAAAALPLLQPTAAATQPEVALDIKEVLADRAQRQLLEASLRTAAPAAVATPVGPRAVLTVEAPAARALLDIPELECIDDFTRYLADDNIRSQVISRFTTVVEPLLSAGAAVEVISHSWGTVVAYEALRGMDDGGPDLPDGSVRNFFTVGSALAIPPVKRRLLPSAIDGSRPRVVATWVNLNAMFDIVGGPLRGNPFAVDYEYLGLTPVGCSLLIPNPVCAHSSYFRPENVAVNQDIFGRYIES
jgi:hypothetical protein